MSRYYTRGDGIYDKEEKYLHNIRGSSPLSVRAECLKHYEPLPDLIAKAAIARWKNDAISKAVMKEKLDQKNAEITSLKDEIANLKHKQEDRIEQTIADYAEQITTERNWKISEVRSQCELRMGDARLEHIASLTEKNAEIKRLQEELERRDSWQQQSKEFQELGGCPVCFASDETGHTNACPWGQILKALQDAALRLGVDPEGCLTDLPDTMAGMIREQEDRIEQLSKDIDSNTWKPSAVGSTWRNVVALKMLAVLYQQDWGRAEGLGDLINESYRIADKFVAAGGEEGGQ